MPPWSAASGYGHFANDTSLTGREISLILSWADGGAPSGVLLVDEDKPPVFIPPLNAWELGSPDETVKFANDVKIAADSPYRIDHFEVATGFKQAKWLRVTRGEFQLACNFSADVVRVPVERTEIRVASHAGRVEDGDVVLEPLSGALLQ